MTNENTTEATEPEVTEDPTTAPATNEAPPEEGTGTGNEAAKYRRRLRDTETERDGLRGQVETLQRAEVERIAADKIMVPGGLWAGGTDLGDMLDDAGNVDREKVLAAVEGARSELGLEGNKRMGNYVPGEGSIPAPPRSGGFEDSLA